MYVFRRQLRGALWGIAGLLPVCWMLSRWTTPAGAVPPRFPPEQAHWTLHNSSHSIRVSHFRDGGLGLTSQWERASGREWGGSSEFFRIEGTYQERPFSLTGRERWRLLAARRWRAGQVRSLRLRVRSESLPLALTLNWRFEPGEGPYQFGYTVEALADGLRIPPGRQPARPPLPGRRPDDPSLGREGPAGSDRAAEAAAGAAGSRPPPPALLCGDGHRGGREHPVAGRRERRRRGCNFGWAFSAFGRFTTTRSGRALLVEGGLDPDHFRHALRAGERLVVPDCLVGLYHGDLDRGVAGLHDFLRAHWLPRAADPRFPLVHYNTWTALYQNVNERNVTEQIDAARDLVRASTWTPAGTGPWATGPVPGPVPARVKPSPTAPTSWG